MLPARELSRGERLDWLRLIRSENVGPITFYQLLHRFGSAAKALEAIPDLARRGGRKRPIRICSRSLAQAELEKYEAAGVQLIARCEPAYPKLLRSLDDAPPLLSVKGHANLLSKDQIGVVGARNASAVAIRFTNQISTELGRAGLVVTSGLARGIDTAAHIGALSSGTVAVLGGGIDVVYPPENNALYENIAQAGCVIAEQPIGTQPQARHFPRRNRLISGLSLGVLVVEAALKSGSLITARMALEQGREVFAVPGSPLDPRAQGANSLIRQGATLVERAEDILDVLDGMRRLPLEEEDASMAPPPPTPVDEAELAPARALVLEKLGPSAVEVDELIRQCHLTPAVILTILLELELAGRLERHPGGKVSIL